MDAKNVTTAKPKVGGAIFRAPLGTKLPVNAKEELAAAFKDLGYISDEGLKNANGMEASNIKAWGGSTVITMETGKPDDFSYTLLECTNVETLKSVYGDENVSGTLEEGITIRANSKEQEPHAYVFDMILKGGILKRIVVANGQLSNVGEITYSDSAAVAYAMTLSAVPGWEDGDTHKEYIVKPQS